MNSKPTPKNHFSSNTGDGANPYTGTRAQSTRLHDIINRKIPLKSISSHALRSIINDLVNHIHLLNHSHKPHHD